MSTLGVVIPTRNSAARLAGHLEGLAAWLDLATEVWVVDSESVDGTVEMLRQGVRHPRLQFLSHPPGLYASWNHGLKALGTEFAYLATVGDTITREGIEHLLAVAKAHQADVVMSKPRFLEAVTGAEVKVEWPIDDMLAYHAATGPLRLRPLEMVIFAAAHPDGGQLGSSASNLYRTATLQRQPFPVGYGVAGDGVWAVQHAHELAWSVTPTVCSTFLFHPTDAGAADVRQSRIPLRLDRVLAAAIQAAEASGQIAPATLAALGWPDLSTTASRWLDAKQTFDRYRRGRFPWILDPRAWRARQERTRLHHRLQWLKRQALARLAQ